MAGRELDPRAIGLKVTGLLVVMAQYLHVVGNLAAKVRCQHRAGQFYPVLGVAGHKICGGEIDLSIIFLSENIDPGMLQKAAYHRKDLNMVGKAWDTGAKAGDAADVHQDMDSGSACLDQFVDHHTVCKRIAFKKEKPPVSFCDLPVYKGQKAVPKTGWGGEKTLAAPA